MNDSSKKDAILAKLAEIIGGDDTEKKAEPITVAVTNLRQVYEASDPDGARITGFVPELNADCVVAGSTEEAEPILKIAKPGAKEERKVTVDGKELVFVERDVLGVRVTADINSAVRTGTNKAGKPFRRVSLVPSTVKVQKSGYRPTGAWA